MTIDFPFPKSPDDRPADWVEVGEARQIDDVTRMRMLESGQDDDARDSARPPRAPENGDRPALRDVTASLGEPGDHLKRSAVHDACRTHGVDADDRIAAVGKAYDVVRNGHAPLIVKHSADMLDRFRHEAAENPHHAILFLGRDAHALAIAVKTLDPDFFARHCHEVVLSRRMVEAAIQDAEATMGRRFDAIADFRKQRDKVEPTDVPGAFTRLTEYLERHGAPVAVPGSRFSVVDTSYKGSLQEGLSALYPTVVIRGHYLCLGVSPTDPHPDAKTGYAVHLPPSHSNNGRTVSLLPDDPSLTFSHEDAVLSIEDMLHGTKSSAARITPDLEPDQRKQAPPTDELNPLLIAAVYRDENTRLAVMDTALVAVQHYAEYIVEMRSGGLDWRAILDRDAAAHVDQVRSWIRGHGDPHYDGGDFAMVMNSFVRRSDRAAADALRLAIASSGIDEPATRSVWEQYTLRGPPDKEAFVAEFHRKHNLSRGAEHHG